MLGHGDLPQGGKMTLPRHTAYSRTDRRWRHARNGAIAVASPRHDHSIEISRCDDCAVRHKAVCGALSDLELARLNQISRRRMINAGQTIMSDEDPAEFFANVISGVIKLTKTLADGRQQIVGLLFAPDFLGRAFSPNNPYFAEAATEVELCSFPHDGFQRILREFPGIEHRLFEQTLDDLDAAREWMVLLGRKTATEKVASFLLLLARRSTLTGCAHVAAPEVPRFELPLTRADIADYLGLTIETVSRQITRLKSAGTIRLLDNRLFVVPDMAMLVKAAGQEMPAVA
jgi:CRP/FNR family transcriptional regulator